MKRRIISLLLTAALLSAFCFPVFAAWSGVGEKDSIAWEVDDNYALTVFGQGAMENHSPAGAGWGSWINKNITAETKWAVRANQITSILVKEGITAIGNAAFAKCTASTQAVLEEGIETIGSHAFLENSRMTQITIPASVKEIGYMAFYGCSGLTDVYYGGTEAMWAEVSVGSDNGPLLNATIHFTEPPKEPEPPKPFRRLGDVNYDGRVDYSDALLVLRCSIGLEELDEESLRVADVNDDGKPDYSDALKILRASIGLESLEVDVFEDPELTRGVMEYENEYIRQHLEFIDSGDYQNILLIPGGMAGALSNTYEEAKLNIINNIWGFSDKLIMAVGKGEIELVNEYELLVADVMQSSGSQDNFLGSYEENYFSAVLQLVNGINKQLKQCKDNVKFFTGESVEKVEELSKKLDDIIVTLQTLDGVPEKDAKGLFADAMEQVKTAFDETYIKDNKAFLDAVKNSLGIALDVSGLISESVTDLMDAYILYNAMAGASEEWDEVWSAIATKARVYDDKIGPKLAEAIEHILAQTREYREDEAEALVTKALGITGTNLVEYAYSKGYEVLEGMMNKSLTLSAIRTGLVQGVNAGNAFTNMDDVAYYGKMMAGYGHLAQIAFDIMKLKGESLVWYHSYENALLYDMAFNVYRNTQLACFESGINYCQAMATAHAANAQLSSEKAMEAATLLPHKLKWEGYKCHGITQIENNGGNVVGWNGNIYYFRIGKGNYEPNGTNGSYMLDPKAKNDLVVRAPDGSEKVIISTESSGNIWICSNRILYRKGSDGWYYVDLKDAGKEHFYTKSSIIGYIQEEDMLVLQQEDGKVYTADTRGNETDIVAGDYTAIAVKDGYYYHYAYQGDGIYQFYRYNLADEQVEKLGGLKATSSANLGHGIADICISENGLYILAGFYGGSGNFFQSGTICYLPFEGSLEVILDGKVKYPMMYLAKETLEDGTQEDAYLYYYTTTDVVGMSLFQGAQSKDVSRLDLRTGKTETVTFPLCTQGVPFIYEGQVLVLDGGLEPSVILPADAAAEMGCGILGFREDGSAAYHKTVDKVGDDLYIRIIESREDPSANMGWRPGYAWNFIKLFRYTPETGDWELIHSAS